MSILSLEKTWKLKGKLTTCSLRVSVTARRLSLHSSSLTLQLNSALRPADVHGSRRGSPLSRARLNTLDIVCLLSFGCQIGFYPGTVGSLQLIQGAPSGHSVFTNDGDWDGGRHTSVRIAGKPGRLSKACQILCCALLVLQNLHGMIPANFESIRASSGKAKQQTFSNNIRLPFQLFRPVSACGACSRQFHSPRSSVACQPAQQCS